MAMRKTRARRKAPKAKRRGRKPAARPRKMVSRQTDRAVVVEGAQNTLTMVVDPVTLSAVYAYNYTTSLSEYQRAQEVAHAYKYYRCAKIELQFVPYANFSSVGGAPNARLPQMYFTVDRVANQWILPTEEEMIERGISPKIFKGKLVYAWKPSLLQNVQLETEQPGDGGGNPLGIQSIGAINSVPLFNKWLPTQQSFGYNVNAATPPNQTNQVLAPMGQNPYALKYHGAIYCSSIEGQTPSTSLVSGDLQIKITWEFKGPRALKTNAPLMEPYDPTTSSMGNPGAVPNTQPTTYP